MSGQVLITGAARGIGLAIALRLLGDGWAVVATTRGPAPELEREREERPLELITCDLRDDDDVEALIERVRPLALRGIVHNAGTLHLEEPGTFSLSAWRETLEVNVIAPVRITLSLAQDMGDGAAVVNIASTDGNRGSYDSAAYGASKAALVNATASLSNLLAPNGVRVNAVSPGWIDTEMGTKERDAAEWVTPQGRIGAPHEVAAAVSWLLSEEASFVTGANLVVDGGYIQADNVLKLEAGL